MQLSVRELDLLRCAVADAIRRETGLVTVCRLRRRELHALWQTIERHYQAGRTAEVEARLNAFARMRDGR